MTVQELRDKLDTLPPNLQVGVWANKMHLPAAVVRQTKIIKDNPYTFNNEEIVVITY